MCLGQLSRRCEREGERCRLDDMEVVDDDDDDDEGDRAPVLENVGEVGVDDGIVMDDD